MLFLYWLAVCSAILKPRWTSEKQWPKLKVHWVLQQAASVLLLGTRAHFQAAAEASSEAQQCVAVAWSLEVRLGGLL